MKKQLRDYQSEISKKGIEILKQYGLVYLSMEVRTGKTATALEIAFLNNAKTVLFLTKKRAIASIWNDYKDFGYDGKFILSVSNDESIHLIDAKYDLVIHDEHHRFGAFPKPNKTAKIFKDKFGKTPMIFLSGTPHPESYSQIFHQFWVKTGFWKRHINFYKWANDYVVKKKKHLGYAEVNDYTEVNPEGMKFIRRMQELLFISYTQKESGFNTSVNKKVIYCEMSKQTHYLRKQLLKNLFLNIDGKDIIADTAVKLQNKIHQLSSGSVITECKDSLIVDNSKAVFINDYFRGKKLAIFYFFKSEYDILKDVFGDYLTNDLEDFNNSHRHIALQQISGAEGISLAKADVLIFYNFGFSNVKFTQAIDRLTTMERKENDVYFIFGRGGIEEKIYNRLELKKDYITSAFKKDYGIKFPKKVN
jgi:hypothetical protein